VIEGLLGRKLGIIQVLDKAGRLRGATVIEAGTATGPCSSASARRAMSTSPRAAT